MTRERDKKFEQDKKNWSKGLLSFIYIYDNLVQNNVKKKKTNGVQTTKNVHYKKE